MIIYETRVRTRLELRVLFEKLKKAGFKWKSGIDLLTYIDIVDYFPAWIEITDTKKVVWGESLVPKEMWWRFE